MVTQKGFYLISVLIGWYCMGFTQEVEKEYSWELPPQSGEKEIGVYTTKISAGTYYPAYYEDDWTTFHEAVDFRKSLSKEELYESLLSSAEEKYKATYPSFILRNFKYDVDLVLTSSGGYNRSMYKSYEKEYSCSAIVVTPDPVAKANTTLSIALDKALRNVRQGSRMAVDQISVISGISREDYKDNLIDLLLDKGYKVIAKEYLERIWEEQQNQKSGIYNDNTTVQDNNFSAVGYYVNVKVTENSIRVQVINISTGEYDGNSIINY